MAETAHVGIIGGGWPGTMHARGYLSAGGFKVDAIADLIPDRRRKLMAEFQVPREYASAEDLLKDVHLDAVSVCLPNHLHAPVVLAALKAGKHVICEPPPTLDAREAKKLGTAAAKVGKVLLYAMQRRFGGHEQAARAAIAKGFIGEPYHVRCVWTRSRAIPLGTGWYTHREKSGGGALIDIGLPMLDIGWNLLGQPLPVSMYGVTQSRFGSLVPQGIVCDVEDEAFALVKFENGKSLELAVSWAINQPQNQNGTVCRVYGTQGAIEVYTPTGATLLREFKPSGECRQNPLKPPKATHYVALMRHFKDCIAGRAAPLVGVAESITLMEMIDGIYKSAAAGKATTA